ncbi:MAG: carbohydrate ABC transporter permease [Tyzzerella sp.]|nr:carbohydrate ABC transporter permease [Tyzzerella sp.]
METKLTPGGIVWKIFKIIIYSLMVFFSITFVGIFVWVLINSFKTAPDFMQNALGLPEIKWDYQNYFDIFKFEYKNNNLFQMLGNTLIMIAINVICTISFPVMAGYVFGRMEFKGRAKFEAFLYVLMTIPVIGGASAQLKFLSALHLYDSYLGIFILSSGAFGSGMLILTSLFRGLPSAYAEAAYMDGAGEFTVFFKIYYPQAIPLLSINVITSIIAVWNDYMTAYIFLPTHPTIALGLQQLQRTADVHGSDYPLMFAGIILTMLPVFIVFSFIAKNIFNSKDIGALK